MKIKTALGTRRMAANILPVVSVGKKSAMRRTARIDAEEIYKTLLLVMPSSFGLVYFIAYLISDQAPVAVKVRSKVTSWSAPAVLISLMVTVTSTVPLGSIVLGPDQLSTTVK